MGLAVVLAIRQTPPASSVVGDDSRAMFAAAMSNQSLIAYACRPVNQEWNLLGARLEYTTPRQSPVSTGHPKPGARPQ